MAIITMRYDQNRDVYMMAKSKPCSECKGQEPLRSDCKRCGGEGVEWR